VRFSKLTTVRRRWQSRHCDEWAHDCSRRLGSLGELENALLDDEKRPHRRNCQWIGCRSNELPPLSTGWSHDGAGSSRRPKSSLRSRPYCRRKTRLYDSMLAYAGTYVFEGDKVIHRLDMSWNQAWTGSEQIRFCQLDGKQLTLMSPASKNPLDGENVVHTIVFEKIG
jgi:Lipocalin-like domain